jgi:hypothetical protein
VDITTVDGVGPCGSAANAGAIETIDLTCGSIDLGGGASTFIPSRIPAGSTNRVLVDCAGDDCVVAPTTVATECWDCTDTGCFFGTPQPIENGGTSLCLVNRLATPVSGNIDRSTGSTANLSIEVASNIFLSGVPGATYVGPDSVCPVCQNGSTAVVGTPSMPVVGTCNGGQREGLACRSTNVDGLTKDCPPGGDCAPGEVCGDASLNLGTVALDLTPLTTGVATRTAADGLFCAGQGPMQIGCFGRSSDANPDGFPGCRVITENGSPAGESLVAGEAKGVTLATVFCVPSASQEPGDIGEILDLAINLPGPGAMSLRATLTFNDPATP